MRRKTTSKTMLGLGIISIRFITLIAAFTTLPTLANGQADILSPISRGSYDPSYATEADTNGMTTGLSLPLRRTILSRVQSTPFGFDERTGQVFVNGLVFHRDDNAAALASEAALDRPLQPMPSNFRPVEISEFGRYIKLVRFRMEHPIRARVEASVRKVVNYFKKQGRKRANQKRKIEKIVHRCWTIAEKVYPAGDGDVGDYAERCIDQAFDNPKWLD
jgi:hypothetical protein